MKNWSSSAIFNSFDREMKKKICIIPYLYVCMYILWIKKTYNKKNQTDIYLYIPHSLKWPWNRKRRDTNDDLRQWQIFYIFYLSIDLLNHPRSFFSKSIKRKFSCKNFRRVFWTWQNMTSNKHAFLIIRIHDHMISAILFVNLQHKRNISSFEQINR